MSNTMCLCGRTIPSDICDNVMSKKIKRIVCTSCGRILDRNDVVQEMSPDDELAIWFDRYHNENPNVYRAFKEMAYEIRSEGHRRYGAKTIMERLRWESHVRYKGLSFKLSNNVKDRCTARYARMLISQDKSFDGFFSIRELTKKRQRDAMSRIQKKGDRRA